MNITVAQEDYLEAIFLLSRHENNTVRITDIAKKLGCKLPTVSRTVKTLIQAGYLLRESRNSLLLTEYGKKVAQQIRHRHEDIEDFLNLVLCVPKEQAISDTCKIEHGFSSLSTRRLHAFMLYFHSLDPKTKKTIQSAVQNIDNREDLFENINTIKTNGMKI